MTATEGTLMGLTRQQLYDNAVNGLAAQDWMKSDGAIAPMCRYRSSDGKRKCAIGHSIPDEVYQPEWDRMMATGPDNGLDAVCRVIGVREVDVAFARALQRCHDKSNGPAAMRILLREFGEKHDLKVPAVLARVGARSSDAQSYGV